METLEQIKADAVEVFCYDREVRPQDRAHAYLGKYRVRRGYNDTAMQVAVVDMIERAYEAGRAGIADANLVQNLRRQPHRPPDVPRPCRAQAGSVHPGQADGRRLLPLLRLRMGWTGLGAYRLRGHAGV